MSVSRTARDRVRDEVTREILVVAGTHLAEEGAAALSLRSIARDLGMAPSALYRYFDGRDALLSALIVAAYTSLADEAERAADAAGAVPGGDAERWRAAPLALRAWALARPHEWGLLFGSPVPGYRAPEETTVPYTRLAAAVLRPVVVAQQAGRLALAGHEPDASEAMAVALAPVHDALMPGATTDIVLRALQAWSTLIGVISLEVFGHWRHTVLDPELFFDRTVEALGEQIGLPR
jgi:AcrR family transcriptional regulator